MGKHTIISTVMMLKSEYIYQLSVPSIRSFGRSEDNLIGSFFSNYELNF